MFGAIAKDIIVPGHDNTEAGLLKWLSDTAQKQIGGSPDLSSRAVAERLNISRRTLEGYRIGNPMPLATCWLLAALIRELRESASGLVLRSTPSETATRGSATQLALGLGLVPVTDDVAKVVLDGARKKRQAKGKTASLEGCEGDPMEEQNHLGKIGEGPGKRTAATKRKPSSKTKSPSTKKSPTSSKQSKPSYKSKSPSTKKSLPSVKQRKPSSK